MDEQDVSGNKMTWLEAWNMMITEYPDVDEHEAIILFMDFWTHYNMELKKAYDNLWQSIVENIVLTIRHIAIAMDILQGSEND